VGEEHISRLLSLKISDIGVTVLLDFIHCLTVSYLKLQLFRSCSASVLAWPVEGQTLISLLGSLAELVSALDQDPLGQASLSLGPRSSGSS
jgi:hypothetical protein